MHYQIPCKVGTYSIYGPIKDPHEIQVFRKTNSFLVNDDISEFDYALIYEKCIYLQNVQELEQLLNNAIFNKKLNKLTKD